MSEMKARMLRGELYLFEGRELEADYARAQELLERYNATRHAEQQLRDDLLRELLAEVGDGVVIRPSFRCDYGSHISIGAGTFVNYDCVLLDVAPIRIGAACQIATCVQLLTATHPVDPVARRRGGSRQRRSRSATTSGSVVASSCAPASRSATTRSWGRAQS